MCTSGEKGTISSGKEYTSSRKQWEMIFKQCIAVRNGVHVTRCFKYAPVVRNLSEMVQRQ